MKIRNDVKYYQEIKKRMTKRDKVNFVIVAIVIGLISLFVIAGTIVLEVTENPVMLIVAILCFIGFGFTFPIYRGIKMRVDRRAIEKGNDVIQGVATITSVFVSWHKYKKNKAVKLTLLIRCTINGTESVAWYKFKQEELKHVETEFVRGYDTYSFRRGTVSRHTEITLDALDKLFKKDDKIVVKYRLSNPSKCIIVNKINENN